MSKLKDTLQMQILNNRMVNVPRASKKYFGRNTLENRMKIYSAICSRRKDIEEESKKILICKEGNYFLLELGEDELARRATRQDKNANLHFLDKFERRLGLALTNHPEIAPDLRKMALEIVRQASDLELKRLNGNNQTHANQ